MSKQDRPSTSAPRSDTPRTRGWLAGIDAIAAIEQERRHLERIRKAPPVTPIKGIGEQLDALTVKVDALASALAEIKPTTIFVSRPAAAPVSTAATPVAISNVSHNHIAIAVKPECDRTHIDDVMEDDEVYVDWSKKGPKN